MKIIIAGGGFGGLRLARKLNNKPGLDVVLIDKYNFHQFQPLYYQVATSGLDASNISFPFRKVFQKSNNVRYHMGNISRVDTALKTTHTQEGETLRYDALVIATGAGTNFFGNEAIAAHAMPMKTTIEALQIRYKLLQQLEDADRTTDAIEKQALLNVVIVGGGPTGVELAGAIADLKNDVLPKDYPDLDISKLNVYLLEGSQATLSAMSEKSQQDSLQYLTRLGVHVKLNTLLQHYDGKTAITKDGIKITTHLVIWAAGIKGNIMDGIRPDVIVKANRIAVNRLCEVEGYENVYAIGDVAYMEEPAWPKGHPQVAPVAIQMADMLAHNLPFVAKKSPAKNFIEFEYTDKGSMATVGRNLAVVDVPKPKLHLKGFIAWMIWMSLHLMLILGVKNKFSVFSNWVYNYFTRDQNLRLIFKETRRNLVK